MDDRNDKMRPFGGAQAQSQSYAWYVVAILMLAYACSFLDRYVLGLLVEPIKRDFGLSDTKISLLQGFSFSLFYVIAGLPIGRLVDRRRRMTLIAVGVAVWSMMTVGCGLAGGFLGLLICRVGVAAGEATLLPAGFSVLTDYVRPARRGIAFAVFTLGVYIGGGLAFMLGGVLILRLAAQGGLTVPFVGAIRPWQGVFVLLGLPGLLLAFWIATLREPARSGVSTATEDARLSAAYRYFVANRRTLVCLLLSGAIASMHTQAITAWVPSFLVRTYAWSLGEAGRAFGTVVLACGIPSVLIGGFLGDALVARGRSDGRLLAMVASSALALPFAVATPLMDAPALAIAALAAGIFFNTLLVGNNAAALQDILPAHLRGLGVAVAVLVINLIGLGLGPTAVAFVTDYVLRDERLLRYSLTIVSGSALALSVLLGLGGLRPYRKTRAALAAGL